MKKRKSKRVAHKAGVKAPTIDITKAPEYRAVYASGVFGGLDPNDSRIIFFLDRLKPKMKKGDKGIMELEKVERELQVEVHMSPNQFISMAKWMNEHAGRSSKKSGSKKKETGTSYIG